MKIVCCLRSCKGYQRGIIYPSITLQYVTTGQGSENQFLDNSGDYAEDQLDLKTGTNGDLSVLRELLPGVYVYLVVVPKI